MDAMSCLPAVTASCQIWTNRQKSFKWLVPGLRNLTSEAKHEAFQPTQRNKQTERVPQPGAAPGHSATAWGHEQTCPAGQWMVPCPEHPRWHCRGLSGTDCLGQAPQVSPAHSPAQGQVLMCSTGFGDGSQPSVLVCWLTAAWEYCSSKPHTNGSALCRAPNIR